MPKPADPLAVHRAEIGRRALELKRKGPSDPDTVERLREAQAEYAEAKIAAFVKRVVETAPPLSTERRDRLALLLRGGVA